MVYKHLAAASVSSIGVLAANWFESTEATDNGDVESDFVIPEVSSSPSFKLINFSFDLKIWVTWGNKKKLVKCL